MDDKERPENLCNQETYTDEEVRSIAYKYMDYRARHRCISYMVLPVLLLGILISLIIGNYIVVGIIGGITIFLICCDVFWIYKVCKKEERRLRDKYGDEFLERATWFKKRKKD